MHETIERPGDIIEMIGSDDLNRKPRRPDGVLDAIVVPLVTREDVRPGCIGGVPPVEVVVDPDFLTRATVDVVDDVPGKLWR